MKLAVSAVALLLASATAQAQWRVGSDSSSRWTRFGRDAAYGTLEALAFSGVDQLRKQPPEWGTGWRGYGRRFASNEGEFLIQEGVTEGLAAALHRPLDYQVCRCRATVDRLAWALKTSVTDPLPNGKSPLAIPRIVGAYAGALAQASWRPANGESRGQLVLVNGTTSLLIGAGINLWREFRRELR